MMNSVSRLNATLVDRKARTSVTLVCCEKTYVSPTDSVMRAQRLANSTSGASPRHSRIRTGNKSLSCRNR